jgi:HEAT repeat protein
MYAWLICFAMFAEPELLPIPQIVATLKAETKELAALTRSRRVIETPGTLTLPALRKHGVKMIPALKEMLTDESPLVRKNGIFALSCILDATAEREILPLLDDSELSVRITAASHLTMLQEKAIRVGLMKALSDEDVQMRKTVTNSLRISAGRTYTKKDIPNYDRAAMIKALGQLVNDPDEEVRCYLCYTLETFHDSNCTQPFLKLLQDQSPKVRALAARGLATTDSAQASAPALLAALNDQPEVAQAAAYALGQLREPLATKPLIQCLEKKELRRQTVIALGMIGDRRATEPLIKHLADTDADIRRETALALGKIRDERAIEPLIAAIVKEQERPYLMVPALGEFNDPLVIEPLVKKMFSDADNQYLADAGDTALSKIKHPNATIIPVEAALAKPDKFAAFVIRRRYGHSFSLESFIEWWLLNKAHYEAAR